MSEKPSITSSELGTLWLTYQEKTMTLRIDYCNLIEPHMRCFEPVIAE
ncbi:MULTISPECIES: hypothetical protein [Bacillaceae]|uniref:Uncharacterized protein n=1 Tax=Evansella alkalicola TaxID=745819 RepID=A0ABS6JST7_9BACI|nr:MULTISPECIES: hypothetical protein [Bacillaceae]MBU9721628.1 hypothetical protein [Bacillus alkalicola]